MNRQPGYQLTMHREKFTTGRIAAYTCKPGQSQTLYWDAAAPGLGLRVTPSGSKSFIFQSKLHGRDIRVTIGDARAWGIDQARAEARRLRTQIDRGIDPREQQREQKAQHEAKREQQRRHEITLGEVWLTYIEARKHRWSERHLADHYRMIRAGGEARPSRGRRKGEADTTIAAPLAELMPLQLADLTPERVALWMKAERERRPTWAALAYRMLRACLRWAAAHPEYAPAVHVEAVTSRLTKDHVPRVKAKEGDALQREQLAPWFAAVRALPNPVVSAYLQTLLLTGARREELARLRWADVDFQWKALTLRDKVEGERTIPLTPYVARLLIGLPRRNDFVFSSPTSASGCITAPNLGHDRALTAAGLPHVTLHGLRRSFGTLAEWVEATTGVVAQIMGHKPSALAEKHYRRRPLDLLRLWHTRIEAWILEQAGIEQPQENAQPGLRLVASNSINAIS